MEAVDLPQRLRDREQELLDDMERNRTEAREDTQRDASEALERSVNMEGAETLLRHNDADYRELMDVQAAIARVEDGTFGKCVDCGKPIPPGRLEAIPWARYCIEDQQRHDSELGEGHSLTM